MKLKAMKKVLSLVLICLLLVPTIAGLVSFAAEAPTVEIVSNNVWYGETLNLQYAVKTTNADGWTVKLDVTVDGEAVAMYYDGKQMIEKYGEELDVFTATKGVAAQDIDTVYTATVSLVKGEEVILGNTTTYSVLEYLNERLYVSEDTTTVQADVYTSLITYAEKADAVLNGNNSIAEALYVYIEGGESGLYQKGNVITATTDRTASEGMELMWELFTVEGKSIGYKTLEEVKTEGIEISSSMLIKLAEVEAGAELEPVTATITFDNASKRTEYSTTIQVWTENGVLVTNNKAASTTNVGDYVAPARFYKSSEVTIEFAADITSLQIDCKGMDSKYVTPWTTAFSTISGATVTSADGVVTVEFAEAVTSVTVTLGGGQARANSITVNP